MTIGRAQPSFLKKAEIQRQDMIGDCENDPVFKERFQLWLNEAWGKKDRRIGEMVVEG